MADVTTVPDLQYSQWSRADAPNPRLASPIAADATTITVTSPPLDEDGNIVEKAFIMGIKTNGYTEAVYVPAQAVQGYGNAPDATNTGLTITGVTRGINIAGIDITTGTSSRRVAHNQDAPVFFSISAVIQGIVSNWIYGNIGSGNRDLLIGDGTTAAQQGYGIDVGGANPVVFGTDTSGEPLIQKSDGSSFTPGAGVGSISGGDGIDITSSVISVDLDTDPGIEFNSGKIRAKIGTALSRDSNGINLDVTSNVDWTGDFNVDISGGGEFQLDGTAVTATATEINQALGGVSANVTDTNLNTLTAGASTGASTLHNHTPTIIINQTRTAASGSGTQSIAHGLSYTPTYVNIEAFEGSSTRRSTGWANGTTSFSNFFNGTSVSTTTNVIEIGDGTDIMRATGIAFDATNIDITWLKVNSGKNVTFNITVW